MSGFREEGGFQRRRIYADPVSVLPICAACRFKSVKGAVKGGATDVKQAGKLCNTARERQIASSVVGWYARRLRERKQVHGKPAFGTAAAASSSAASSCSIP